MKENKIAQIKERKRLEEIRTQLTSQIEELEPTLKQTTGWPNYSHIYKYPWLISCVYLYLDTLNSVTPKIKELADGLDIYRHQIRLFDINEFKKEETDELIQVFKNSATLSEDVKVEKFDQVIKAANVISGLDGTNAMQIRIMEEYIFVLFDRIYLSFSNLNYFSVLDAKIWCLKQSLDLAKNLH